MTVFLQASFSLRWTTILRGQRGLVYAWTASPPGSQFSRWTFRSCILEPWNDLVAFETLSSVAERDVSEKLQFSSIYFFTITVGGGSHLWKLPPHCHWMFVIVLPQSVLKLDMQYLIEGNRLGSRWVCVCVRAPVCARYFHDCVSTMRAKPIFKLKENTVNILTKWPQIKSSET